MIVLSMHILEIIALNMSMKVLNTRLYFIVKNNKNIENNNLL